MKVHELKQKRATAIKGMQKLAELQSTEKRSLTEDENSEYEAFRSEIADLDSMIERAIELEELARSLEGQNFDPPKPNAVESFNIADAMRMANDGNITGIAEKMRQEASDQGIQITNNNTLLIPEEYMRMNTIDGAAITHKDVATDLDIIVPTPIYSILGCKVLRGLNGNLGLPTQIHNVATFPGESTTVITNPNKPTQVEIKPQRIGLTETFSKELLASGNSRLFSAIISDMVEGIDSGISKKVITMAVDDAGNSIPAATVLDAETLTKLEETVEANGGQFVMTRALFGGLKHKAINDSSGGRTILNGKFESGETYDGYKAMGSSWVPDKGIVFGDFSHATIGFWDGIEIIVNPYSKAKTGEIEITVNRLADAVLRNTAAFSSYTDASIA